MDAANKVRSLRSPQADEDEREIACHAKSEAWTKHTIPPCH